MNSPVPHHTLAHYVAAHASSYSEYGDLAAGCTDEQWALPSLCPGWDLRGCMAHAIGLEKLLTGWAPSAETPPPFGDLDAFMSEAAGQSGPEFLAAFEAITTARLAELSSFDPAVVDTPSFTPVGPQSYGDFLRIRIFDMWVHARDIALPLGISLPDGGPNAELALDEVHRSMGYIIGKKVGLPDQMSVTVHVEGGVYRDLHVVVDGRAGLVDALAEPSVEVVADTETFIMLACGRIDPQERIDSGRITWSGDAQWGEAVARNLRFTM